MRCRLWGWGWGVATWLSDARSSPAWGRMGQVSQAGIIARPPTTTADFSWNRFLCKTWRQVGVWQKIRSHRIIRINPFSPISFPGPHRVRSIHLHWRIGSAKRTCRSQSHIHIWLHNCWLIQISIPQRCLLSTFECPTRRNYKGSFETYFYSYSYCSSSRPFFQFNAPLMPFGEAPCANYWLGHYCTVLHLHRYKSLCVALIIKWYIILWTTQNM